MNPELEWERVGDVNNVVFVQGAVPGADGQIITVRPSVKKKAKK